MVLYVLIGFNVLLLFFMIYNLYESKKTKTYGIVMNKDKTVHKTVKFNPSKKEFKVEKDGETESYILNFKPYIKFKNFRLVLYEKGNPEPLNILDDNTERIMTSEVLNELFEMKKIIALNKIEKGLFDKLNSKWLLGGLVIVILIIVLLTGGV